MERDLNSALQHQWGLILNAVTHLQPLKYWERRVGFWNINAIVNRESNFSTGVSVVEPNITGVFTNKDIKNNDKYGRLLRLLDYYGIILTVTEFDKLLTACYTSVDLPYSFIKTFCKYETDHLVLVGNPNLKGAQLVCTRGPGNKKRKIYMR